MSQLSGRRHARQRASPTCALRPRGQRTLQPTALSPRGRRGRLHARQRASPGPTAPCASRGTGARSGPAAGVCWTTPTGYFLKGKGFSRTGKTPGISFLVEIFGEIPPRPGQVGNTWEMHYGTNTGSCGVHLVLLRPSQHSGARPGVVPHHGQILVQSFSLDLCALVNPLFHTLWAIGILNKI